MPERLSTELVEQLLSSESDTGTGWTHKEMRECLRMYTCAQSTSIRIDKQIATWYRHQTYTRKLLLLATVLSSAGVGGTTIVSFSPTAASIWETVVLIFTIVCTLLMDTCTAYLALKDYDDKMSRAGEARRAFQRIADRARTNLVCRKNYRPPFTFFFHEMLYNQREAATRLGELGITPSLYDIDVEISPVAHEGTRSSSVTPWDNETRTACDSE